jgi:YVTN family beta-propeller protein
MNHTPRARTGAALACVSIFLAACGGGESGSGNTGNESGTAPAKSAAAVAGTEGRARALALPSGTTIPADAATRGMFGPVQNWPLIPVHVVLLSDGRVMSFGTDAQGNGRQTGFFNYAVWNPKDNDHLVLPNNTATDLFCSSPLMLADGSAVAISGGDNWTGTGTTNTGNDKSTVFNVATNTLTRGNGINRQRWYGSSTMLLNGEIYLQGGNGGTDRPEVRTANGTYRLLGEADTSGLFYAYPRNFIAPDSRVFGFDAFGRMYYVSPNGNGAVQQAGQLNAENSGEYASAAMFSPGRILQFGGNSNASAVIDITSGAPRVTSSSTMLRRRQLATATILPNGQVLATGGSSAFNQMVDVSYEAETWNPQTGQWTVGAGMKEARLYHSVGLLLPDATVLVAGGGAPGPDNKNNLNGEIYYPPYLFSGAGFAARPVINSAPVVSNPGNTVKLEVTSGRPIARVTLVANGAVTHGWNMNQRFVELPFRASGGTISAQIPSHAADVPPGTWMVFAIDDAGVPSEAKMVRINVAGTPDIAVQPLLTSPGDQSGNVGAAVNLAVTASDPNGDTLVHSASGLPPGLAIAPATGRITGTPTTPGTYGVTLAVSDGVNGTSVNITWTVRAGNGGGLTLSAPVPPSPAATGTAASFTATATGTGVQYSWNFNDGSAATAWSSSGTATHSFAAAGLYTVTVTARDAGGNQQVQTFVHQVHAASVGGGAHPPAMSSAMALETRNGAGTRLWVANPDTNTVSVFDTATRAKVAEVNVGVGPRTLAVAPDGSIWVVNKNSASISMIDPATRLVSRTMTLPRGSRPHGIAMARASNSALVVLEATGQLLKINTATLATATPLAVGPNPRHVSVGTDGRTAYVSRFITPPLRGEGTATVLTTTAAGQPAGGEVAVVDSTGMALQRTLVLAHGTRTDAENQGRGLPNYLGAAAISPDGTQAFVPGKQDNVLRGGLRDNLPLTFQNTVRAISSRLDLAAQREDLAARIDHDDASLASAATFDPLGMFLFVALETSREVAVLDAHGRGQLMRIDVGRAPQAVLVSADRKTLYVQNFMDRTVGVYDLTPLVQRSQNAATPVATLSTVATETLTPAVLLGKQHFHDARDTRLARDRYMSCATCHNDGGHDGRVWDFTAQGEGLRNTTALRGRGGAGHGFMHWSGNFDEVQDFEAQIRSLAGGTGLMSDADFNAGTRSAPLGNGKTGLSPDLDALAAYVASLNTFDPAPARPSIAGLSQAATVGKAVFAAKNCASCHGGATFTGSGEGLLVDIGTVKPSSGKRLGGTLAGIDVPTLRDVWATAPYLHDGSAATLDDAVRAHRNVTATEGEVASLVAYLREIGTDEPAAAHQAGNGTGLAAAYHQGTDLAGTPLLRRTEVVDFDWGTGAPAAGIPADNFSVRWTGTLTAPATGTYRLQTYSDDGVRLWVNGLLLIDNWTDHGPLTDTTVGLNLTAGQQVAIRLEYYERSVGANIQLRWRTPGNPHFGTIPASALTPAPSAGTGLSASYFNNREFGGTPALTRTEAVDFDWATGSPVAGLIGVDNFSVRWTGTLVVPATGTYRFQTVSDDGVRLWLNDAPAIDNWTLHGPTADTSAGVALQAGQRVKVRLDYFESQGGAVMRLLWLPPGQSTPVAIPASHAHRSRADHRHRPDGPLPRQHRAQRLAGADPNRGRRLRLGRRLARRQRAGRQLLGRLERQLRGPRHRQLPVPDAFRRRRAAVGGRQPADRQLDGPRPDRGHQRQRPAHRGAACVHPPRLFRAGRRRHGAAALVDTGRRRVRRHAGGPAVPELSGANTPLPSAGPAARRAPIDQPGSAGTWTSQACNRPQAGSIRPAPSRTAA